MSADLPRSMKDVHYDNAKFRHRSYPKAFSQAILTTTNSRRECMKCSTGKFLVLLIVSGVMYLMLTKTSNLHSGSHGISSDIDSKDGAKLTRFWRKPPRLPPRFSPDELGSNNKSSLEASKVKANSEWNNKQQKVKEAFVHAWSGYKNYSMGYDELMPLSHRGVDSLGGLGATVVDALDTAMIMGIDEVVVEAGSWIEKNLPDRISGKGQVNLFETTIRVLGGLLSAYHLSGEQGGKGPKRAIYLENAINLADRLLIAFTSSPSDIPFSDVILRDRSAHPAPDGMSSTSEVSTLQLEFNYLSNLTGDPKYSVEAMKVLKHIESLPKVEGLVPIYISPNSGEFNGENIRLGSRGDSYYEYLVKVWLQQGSSNISYLYHMYEEAMKGVRHLLAQKSAPNGLVFVGELPYGPKGSCSPKMDHLISHSVEKESVDRVVTRYIDMEANYEGELDGDAKVCFLPGTLGLGATKGITKEKALKESILTFEDIENLKLAEDLLKTCVEMYLVTSTGLSPEIAYFNMEGKLDGGPDGGNKSSKYVHDIVIKPADRHNLLRPETVESLFVLYRITEDPKYREWGWKIFEAFEKYTKVESGGYSSLDDVTVIPPPRRDKMETFFLGETLKYLYLLFGEKDVIPLDKFVFNTEAHPFPILRSNRD